MNRFFGSLVLAVDVLALRANARATVMVRQEQLKRHALWARVYGLVMVALAVTWQVFSRLPPTPSWIGWGGPLVATAIVADALLLAWHCLWLWWRCAYHLKYSSR